MNKRSILIALLAFAMPGCASLNQPIEMTSRDSKAISHGIISISPMAPWRTTIVVDIDRRIYQGTSELAAANETFGLALAYGRKSGAAEADHLLGNHYKAVLSSSDNHVLHCDFTGGEGKQSDGICVDEFGRVYDVASSR